MTTGNGSSHKSFVYVGLAGETAPGRVVNNGLYRMADGDGNWELLTKGLPEAPAVRAIAIHPQTPGTIFVGTQDGPYRTEDRGNHWEKVSIGDHGIPVWSIMFHPRDAKVMFVGYESAEIYRSDDGGERWQQLPVSVRFPEITVGPGANLAKRVLQMSASTANPDEIYGAIEVGGIIRTLDGGEHWENMSHGQYVNDDPVDMHGVLASSFRPENIFGIGRAGMWRSSDQGSHWTRVPIEPLNEKGQTYCRQIREVPGDSKTMWLAAGANFMSDLGVLFCSRDGGANWDRIDMGVVPQSTLFGLTFNAGNPSEMYCAASGGEVWGSHDKGNTWNAYPLPEGATQVYTLACG